jgi:hypothetical protein
MNINYVMGGQRGRDVNARFIVQAYIRTTSIPARSRRANNTPLTDHIVSQTSYTETAGDEFRNWLQVVPVSDEIDPGASGGGVAWGRTRMRT